MEKLNAAPASSTIAQQIQGTPVAPPTLTQEQASAVSGAKPPSAATKAKPAVSSDKKKILTNIFGG
jgi:hypothetical protein